MTYKVYIQSLNGFPISDWATYAYLGFKGGGTDVILFEDIEEVPASKWHIVVADIETTNKYFERIGLPPKMSLNIPEELEDFTGRSIFRCSMGDFRKDNDKDLWKYPLFMKPDGKSKEFVGGVLEDSAMFKRHMSEIPDSTPIMVSNVVKFITEYRVYVCQGEILGVYWYLGDFLKFPDGETIKAGVAAYKDAPAGYAMDFGVLDNGLTVLVECNDGWSLGNYGLEPSKYSRLLARRWHELMKVF